MIMAIPVDNIVFPTAIARGAVGGPRRRTDIVTLGSGAEERNSPWAQSRRVYNIATPARELEEFAVLMDFWEGRRGPLYGFLFRDEMDDSSCRPRLTPLANDQVIAVGDGTTCAFQLVKVYDDPIRPYQRKITRPRTGSVKIAFAGMEVTSGWTVDTSTGIVTFSTPPASGVTIQAGYHFYVPARFEGESLQMTRMASNQANASSISIIELLE